MTRTFWPSKIGTVPGGMVAIKGYPHKRPPEGTVIEYIEVERGPRGALRIPYYSRWRRGTVDRWVGAIIMISRL